MTQSRVETPATLMTSIQEALAKVEAVVNQEQKGEPVALPHQIQQHDSLLSLRRLNEIMQGPEDKQSQQLEAFLQQRWQAMQGTYLSYTSQPHSDLTKVLSQVATYLASHNDQHTALAYLMPTLGPQMDRVSQVDLHSLPLAQVIPFCITSDDNKTLIPVELLSYVGLETDIANVMINPVTMKPLSESEQQRLIHHSLTTEAIVVEKTNFQNASSASNSLYAEVRKLITGLRKGGAHGLQGGTEAVAGPAASDAILQFRLYWSHLSEVQRASAMENESFATVMDKKLLNNDFHDCVEILAKELDAILEVERDAFLKIGLDDSQKQAVIAEYQANFRRAKQSLEQALDPDRLAAYEGRDQHYLSVMQIESLLNAENIQRSEDVLFILKDLQPQEIAAVCALFSEQIVPAIDNVDGLFTILINLGVQQVDPLMGFFKR